MFQCRDDASGRREDLICLHGKTLRSNVVNTANRIIHVWSVSNNFRINYICTLLKHVHHIVRSLSFLCVASIN